MSPMRTILASYPARVLFALVALGLCLTALYAGFVEPGYPLKSTLHVPWKPKQDLSVNTESSDSTLLPTSTNFSSVSTLLPQSSTSSSESTNISRPTSGIGLPPIMVNPAEIYHDFSLAYLALGKVLDNASPIFGEYAIVHNQRSTWMSAYPDDMPIVHMNIPGVHDAATWNYSRATQKTLKHVTDLANDTLEIDPTHYRCQSKPMTDMLNAGIRAFDLRYALDVTNTTLVFWHGPALQSQTATVESVLFGFYQWLDDHPTETLLLSFQYEPSETVENVDDALVQLLLYQILTSPAAKTYLCRNSGRFGSLGEARGKIILLRRFDLDKLPTEYSSSLRGVHFSPGDWIINGANNTLIYNSSLPTTEAETGKAYIQDYYSPLTPQNSSIEENVQAKFDATTAHFHRAASSDYANDLFWNFASSTNIEHAPPVTPRMQALDDGYGVNNRLVPFFQSMRGQRLGIVMFDFFDEPEELVGVFLDLLPPERVGTGV